MLLGDTGMVGDAGVVAAAGEEGGSVEGFEAVVTAGAAIAISLYD
jgi:hypothetical protein